LVKHIKNQKGMRQKWAILLDSVELVQAQHCQVDLTPAKVEER